MAKILVTEKELESLLGYRIVGDEKWLLRENASAIGPEPMTDLEIRLWSLLTYNNDSISDNTEGYF